MATNSITGGNGYTLRVGVEVVSQNVANNTSRIRRWAEINATSHNFSASVEERVWANGSSVHSYSASRSIALNSKITFYNVTTTLTHGADGKAPNQTTRATFQTDSQGQSWSVPLRDVSVSVAVPTIPRATTPNIGGGSFTTAVATTVNLPRAAAAFTHDVSYVVGATVQSIATGAGDSISWAPPQSLMNSFPNSSAGTVKLRVVTKNGSTVIGTVDTDFSLSADASIVPGVGAATWTDTNTFVKDNIAAFVRNRSLISGSVTTTPAFSSPIVSTVASIGGTTFPIGTPQTIPGSGTLTTTVTATDARGRTGSVSGTIAVLDYLAPTVITIAERVSQNPSNLQWVPDPAGTRIRVTLNVIASSLMVASTQKNKLRVRVRTKANTAAAASYIVANTQANLANTLNTTILLPDVYSGTTAWDVEVGVADQTMPNYATYLRNVGTDKPALDLNGTNVGIGKMHQNGVLDVGGDTFIVGDLNITGTGGFDNGVVTTTVEAIDYKNNSGQVLIGASLRGTVDQMNALPNKYPGMRFFVTTENRYYTYSGTVWTPERRYFEGTSAQRAATTPKYGDIWKDFGGTTNQLWRGSSDGRWRKETGRVSFSSTGWSGNWGSTAWARTESYTFPDMWLEPNEIVVANPHASGNGFEFANIANFVSNPTAGTLTVTWRKMQVGSSSNQPSHYTINILETYEII